MRRFGTATALAAVLMLATPMAAMALEWSQEKVTELADQLAGEARKVRDGVEKQWKEADKNSARYVVLDDLMSLQERTVALQALLRAGKGREETMPIYRRILTQVGMARRDGKFFPDVSAQAQNLDAAHKTLGKMAAYYTPPPQLTPLPEESPTPPSEGGAAPTGQPAR